MHAAVENETRPGLFGGGDQRGGRHAGNSAGRIGADDRHRSKFSLCSQIVPQLVHELGHERVMLGGLVARLTGSVLIVEVDNSDRNRDGRHVFRGVANELRVQGDDAA